MTDRRCETCKHWRQPRDTLTGHGECHGVGDELFVKPEPLAVVCPYPSAGSATLFTLPSFFCAMWESK